MTKLPRLYPILDADALARAGVPLDEAAHALYDAGVRWAQYRDKRASDAEVVERMRLLRTIFPAEESVLLLNDRVALWAAAEADGVHIGQDDMPPAEARKALGRGALLGVSTHNVDAVARGTCDERGGLSGDRSGIRDGFEGECGPGGGP